MADRAYLEKLLFPQEGGVLWEEFINRIKKIDSFQRTRA
jgi:hypothetical protein